MSEAKTERPWIENKYRDVRKVPDDAAEWHRNGWRVDTIDEFGRVSLENSIILSFMGPCIVTHYRLAASAVDKLN